MRSVIRQADLESDRERLIATLLRYLTPLSNASRFDWLYRNSPHGQARVWIALDPDDGSVIGMASAFPRRVYLRGHDTLGWVLGDFCVSDRYRSLGLALQLQRACLEAVDSGMMAFCYDFPSDRMMAVYKRLRISPSGHMVRLAKPLRLDRKIGRHVKSPLIARGLSRAANSLLALSDNGFTENECATVSFHEGDCGEEFSGLARTVGSQYGLCLQRSAEYLNWRYRANPLCHYELLTARRDEVLLAYAVVSQVSEDATLVDVFGVNDPAVISDLVNSVVSHCRKRGAATVSSPMWASHAWVGLMQRLGFRAREAAPVVLYSPIPKQPEIGTETNWFVMHGDRDS